METCSERVESASRTISTPPSLIRSAVYLDAPSATKGQSRATQYFIRSNRRILNLRGLTRRLITSDALKLMSQKFLSALPCLYPFTDGPRRIMPHVNGMSAIQVRDPVPQVVLVETDNRPQQLIVPCRKSAFLRAAGHRG